MTVETEADSKNVETHTKSNRFYVPCRYNMAILCVLGLIVSFTSRLSLGIITMMILDHKNIESKMEHQSEWTKKLYLHWDSTDIGILHSTFYIGQLITSVPSGVLAFHSQCVRIFGITILLSSALNLLLPLGIANSNYWATCFVRFSQGLCEGFGFPALYGIMNRWFPGRSIHVYGGWIFGGMYAGPIIGFPIDGTLTHYFSWDYVFYFHSITGVLWFVFWIFCAYERPEDNPSIRPEELKLINEDKKEQVDKLKIPWKEILTSPAVWAINFGHFAKNWMFVLMLTNEPTYFNLFHFTIFENGLFSALPHILKVLMSVMSGPIASYLLNKNIFSRTVVRKLCTCIGFGVESLMCYSLVFANTKGTAVPLLCIGIGMSGLAVSGWQINHLDIAPDFASVLVGLSATVGTVGAILGPLIVGIMTNPQNLENWQKSWLVTASVLLASAIIYSIFGSGERQPWADSTESIPLGETPKRSQNGEVKPAELPIQD